MMQANPYKAPKNSPDSLQGVAALTAGELRFRRLYGHTFDAVALCLTLAIFCGLALVNPGPGAIVEVILLLVSLSATGLLNVAGIVLGRGLFRSNLVGRSGIVIHFVVLLGVLAVIASFLTLLLQ